MSGANAPLRDGLLRRSEYISSHKDARSAGLHEQILKSRGAMPGARVAVAGTNGLAQLLCHFIATTTSYEFVILSRKSVKGLRDKGWQVVVVNYDEQSDLKYKLAGVDTVISTVSGQAQLNLIEAAAQAHVRRFVPSEFGGPPGLRPEGDPLDNKRRDAIILLAKRKETHEMQFAVFVCGVFFERFGPGGLRKLQIAMNSGIGVEGAYILDWRRHIGRTPPSDSSGHPASISLTSMRDTAQFVVAALSKSTWPREFKIRAEQVDMRDLFAIARSVSGREWTCQQYSRSALENSLSNAFVTKDKDKVSLLQHLSATSKGRWDFATTNLGGVSFQPERLKDYLRRVWANPD